MAAYEITVAARKSWLHATVVGERTPENALRFLKEVWVACEKSGHTSVLLEVRFSGPSLEHTDIFRVVSDRSPQGAKLRRIAYVEASGSPAAAEFAETVALNRGVNVRLFKSVAAAEAWLSG